MPDREDRPRCQNPDDHREIADASFVFHDEEKPAESSDAAASVEPNAEPIGNNSGTDGYDLAEPVDANEPSPESAGLTEESPPPVRARPSPRAASRSEEPPSPSLTPAPVSEPWTRLGEWGPSLVRVSLAIVVTLGLVYFLFSPDRLMLCLLLMGFGFAVAVLLSYPIAVTLERPVRMTPEHAIKDFYAAFSHHIPQYRRMWLLLSSAGRADPEYSSYASFQSYWKQQRTRLIGSKGSSLTPLNVQIEDFKAEKSAGQEAIEASFTLLVFIRDKESDGPVYSTRTETTFSRGPDRMWYLDEGRLPGR